MIPILQTRAPFEGFGETDPIATIIMAVFFGILIIAGIVSGVSSRGSGKKAGGRSVGSSLRSDARKAGLSAKDVTLLKEVAKTLSLATPERLVSSDAFFDAALRRILPLIENGNDPESVKEDKKFQLFEIKKKLLNKPGRDRSLDSSRRLRLSQSVRVTLDGKKWLDAVVTGNTKDSFCIDPPRDERDRIIEVPRDKKLGITFSPDGYRVYTFVTTALAYRTVNGVTMLYLRHAGPIKETQKRKSPRRDSSLPTYFYAVLILTTGSGKREKKRAVVNTSKRFFGKIVDLSAGGCAIQSPQPLVSGTLLKIEFTDEDGTPVTAFGKVQGSARTRGGGIMHVMFTRITKKNLNTIQAYVYGVS